MKKDKMSTNIYVANAFGKKGYGCILNSNFLYTLIFI